MSINPHKQSQFELFPGTSGSDGNFPKGKKALLTKDLTLSLENIIVLCILFVMTVVLFFSFGVEKGKRVVVLEEVPESRTSGVRMLESKPQSSGKVQSRSQSGERVVLPIEMPGRLIEEEQDGSNFSPSLEKNDKQESIFTIQVASFKLQKNAQREADRLKGAGLNEAFVVAKGSYSIVCVGKFGQRNEAKKFSGKLKKRYNDCLVRRL